MSCPRFRYHLQKLVRTRHGKPLNTDMADFPLPILVRLKHRLELRRELSKSTGVRCRACCLGSLGKSYTDMALPKGPGAIGAVHHAPLPAVQPGQEPSADCFGTLPTTFRRSYLSRLTGLPGQGRVVPCFFFCLCYELGLGTCKLLNPTPFTKTRSQRRRNCIHSICKHSSLRTLDRINPTLHCRVFVCQTTIRGHRPSFLPSVWQKGTRPAAGPWAQSNYFEACMAFRRFGRPQPLCLP